MKIFRTVFTILVAYVFYLGMKLVRTGPHPYLTDFEVGVIVYAIIFSGGYLLYTAFSAISCISEVGEEVS